MTTAWTDGLDSAPWRISAASAPARPPTVTIGTTTAPLRSFVPATTSIRPSRNATDTALSDRPDSAFMRDSVWSL